MLNALIINGSGFTPCSPSCGSLANLLNQADTFDRIQEVSIGYPSSDINPAPDLILPRFQFQDWASHGMAFCKQQWASARTFVVICDRAGQHSRISPALINVDDFVFCPYQENELLLRLKRLLRIKKPAIETGSDGFAW